MPEIYLCKRCQKPLNPEKDDYLLQYTYDLAHSVVVICPECARTRERERMVKVRKENEAFNRFFSFKWLFASKENS